MTAHAAVRFVEFDRITPDDRDKWRALAARAAEPNLFLEPDYLMPLALAEGSTPSRVMFVERDGAAILVAIVARELRVAGPTSVPVWSTSSDFIERETGYTYPLVDRDAVEDAFDAWFDATRGDGLGGTVWFADLFADGPLAAGLEAVSARRGLPTVTFGHGVVPYLAAGDWPSDAAPTGDDLFEAAHLSRSRRQDMRRAYRKAVEHLGGAPVWRDATGDAGAAEDFVRLQCAGWKGDESRGGYAFGLSDTRTDAFLEFVSAFGVQDRVLIGALESDGRTLHMSVSLRTASGTWTTPFDAYDENYAAIGVGRLGRLATLRVLTSRFPDSDIDPSFIRADGSIGGIFPRQRPRIGVLVGAGGVASRAVVRVIAARDRRK